MIEIKEKKCKGTGKALGYGCSNYTLFRKYGLCNDCYRNWLLNTKEGKEVIKKSTISAKKKVDKEKKSERRKSKELITDYSIKLQTKINEIARLIDIGLPCLARRNHAKQIHAGHIYSRGSNFTMRYNLHNIHRQSAQSNHFQNEDGLLREGLKYEYGYEYVEFISSLRSTPSLHYSNAEYKEFYNKASKIVIELRKKGERYNLKQRIDLRNKINLSLNIYDYLFMVYIKKTDK